MDKLDQVFRNVAQVCKSTYQLRLADEVDGATGDEAKSSDSYESGMFDEKT